MNALRELQTEAGATFADAVSPPLSFGNERDAWQAAQQGVALGDRCHWSQLAVRGDDRQQFLHNQTTNDIKALQPGTSCEAVFVNSTGRTLDLATIYADEEELLVLASPGQGERLLAWLDRYLFPADRVELADRSDSQACFSLFGPQSSALLARLGADVSALGDRQHTDLPLAGTTVRVATGNGLALPGYTLFVAADSGAALWQALHQAGAVPLGERVWQQLRVRQGRPLPGSELTDDFNPLEAGLWPAISFDKGCYIGQETIARLNTYKGVKQRLWGLRLTGAVEPGTAIALNETKSGILTSALETPEGWLGLGYVKTKAGAAGAVVQVGDARGTLVATPCLVHETEVAS